MSYIILVLGENLSNETKPFFENIVLTGVVKMTRIIDPT